MEVCFTCFLACIQRSEIYLLACVEKDDNQLLKHAFRSKNAGPQRQDAILCDHGVRWAAFNSISSWLPASKTVLDFMHNIFLGHRL